jgi:hypothetical protein
VHHVEGGEEIMKMFEVVKEAHAGEAEAKCGSCNWPASLQYVLAESQKKAEELYSKGDAGLCGDCMCRMIVEEGYIVDLSPKASQELKNKLMSHVKKDASTR